MSGNDARETALRAYRGHELKMVLEHLPPEARILEIGAGNGWQALQLAASGHTVDAVDIDRDSRDPHRVYPVRLYDGHKLPFEDASFDVVFSSNVIEHICHIDAFEQEIHRVLKPDGMAIHILPTSSWRLWTSLTHPLYVIRAALALLVGRNTMQSTAAQRRDVPWFHALWPNRHGERGNSLSEIYLFSRRAWLRHFTRTGWHVGEDLGTSLFYTGNQIHHLRLWLPARQALAGVLGSVTRIFVMRRASPNFQTRTR